MLKTRLTIAALIVAILAGIGVLVVVVLPRLFPQNKPVMLNTSTLLQQVQSLSQLITVKYVIEKVVVFEDVKWYGENRVMLIAHGIVKAGVDLGQLKPEHLQANGKKIIVTLPSSTITDAYLDDAKTTVLDRSTGLLRQFDKTLEQAARRTAVDDIKRAARVNGIVKDADERAQQQLLGFFRQLGFEQVEFRTHARLL